MLSVHILHLLPYQSISKVKPSSLGFEGREGDAESPSSDSWVDLGPEELWGATVAMRLVQGARVPGLTGTAVALGELLNLYESQAREGEACSWCSSLLEEML